MMPDLFPVDAVDDATVRAADMTVAVLRLIRRHRFPIGNELAFQNALASVLATEGIDHLREHQLGDRGTIDFYLPSSRLGLELKVKGSPSEVMRQLHRYAQSPDIDGLILITGRARLSSLPRHLNGKPITVASLWEACL